MDGKVPGGQTRPPSHQTLLLCPPAVAANRIGRSAASLFAQPVAADGVGELCCHSCGWLRLHAASGNGASVVDVRAIAALEGQGEVVLLGHVVQWRVPLQLDAGTRGRQVGNEGLHDVQVGGRLGVACSARGGM